MQAVLFCGQTIESRLSLVAGTARALCARRRQPEA